MELYACGLNAHQQLCTNSENESEPSQNLYEFQKVEDCKTVRIFCALWCATILEIDDRLVFRGFHTSGLTNCSISGPGPGESHGIRSVFGDLSGVIGAIADDGLLLELGRTYPQADNLIFRRRRTAWLHQRGNVVDHVSIARNGQIAVVTRKLYLILMYA